MSSRDVAARALRESGDAAVRRGRTYAACCDSRCPRVRRPTPRGLHRRSLSYWMPMQAAGDGSCRRRGGLARGAHGGEDAGGREPRSARRSRSATSRASARRHRARRSGHGLPRRSGALARTAGGRARRVPAGHGPARRGRALAGVLARHRERLTVVIDGTDLRRASLQVEQPLSWEHIYDRVVEAVRYVPAGRGAPRGRHARPDRRCGDGPGRGATLIFDPRALVATPARFGAGFVWGHQLVMLAALLGGARGLWPGTVAAARTGLHGMRAPAPGRVRMRGRPGHQRLCFPVGWSSRRFPGRPPTSRSSSSTTSSAPGARS